MGKVLLPILPVNFKQSGFFLSQQLSVVNSFLVRSGTLHTLPLLRAGTFVGCGVVQVVCML